MDFNIGNLVSGVMGSVAKVAIEISNLVSAVIGSEVAFANANEDGEIDDEEAEELLADYKLLVGAYIALFGLPGAGSESDGEENSDDIYIDDLLDSQVKVTDGAAVTYDENGSPSESKSIWDCVLGVKDYISNGVSHGISNVEDEWNNMVNYYEEAGRAQEESNRNEYNNIAADEEELENLQKQSDQMIEQRIDIEKDSATNKVEWEHQDMEDYIIGDDDSTEKIKVCGNAADAKTEAKLSAYDDGKIDPQVRIGGEAEYSGIKVEGEGEIGDRNLGAGVEGKGGLLNADAEAALKIGRDEVDGKWDACVKGKALASVAEGSVEGKIKICGLEIDLEGTGYAGGIGAEFKGGVENGKFKLKAGAAALLGVGASISIGLAD